MKREDLISLVRVNAAESARALEGFLSAFADALCEAATETTAALAEGKKILVFGNGGSASDAEHLAAEIVGRFKKERRPLPALALTTNSSIMTALSNDYGFERVFERQVRALAAPGDIVIGITTSGKSPNVLLALEAAKELGCKVYGLSGEKASRLEDLCHRTFKVPSANTPVIQECHIAWIHNYCAIIEELWTSQRAGG